MDYSLKHKTYSTMKYVISEAGEGDATTTHTQEEEWRSRGREPVDLIDIFISCRPLSVCRVS